jgi:glucose/mannose-6-phosphate isomerase
MLDDLKYIHEKDAQDALGVAEKQWQQLLVDTTIQGDLDAGGVTNIVFAGMGGSALAAVIAKSLGSITKPFEIVREYNLPAYVDGSTLVIASSYSGNTEETLSGLAEAKEKGAIIAVIAAGGKLVEIAKTENYPYIVLPPVSQPRFAALVGLKALYTILEAASVLPAGNITALEAEAGWLREQVTAWTPTVSVADNQAKQLAQECLGKSVVMYGGPKMYAAAYKWKISINENAKHVAWLNQIPEFSHNEFIGWTKQPVDKPYTVIDLRSNLEHSQVQKRFEISERLLSGQRPAPEVVVPVGETLLQQTLWVIALGDFTSLYLAMLNGLNPTPVDLIENLKKALTE